MSNDHYISKFYLERFWFDNEYSKSQKDIYVYQINQDKLKRTTMLKLGYKKDLFFENVEKNFWKYEYKLSKLLKKIDNAVEDIQKNINISQDLFNLADKELLSRYVEFQYGRSAKFFPWYKEQMESDIKNIIEWLKGVQTKFNLKELEELLKEKAEKDVHNYLNIKNQNRFTSPIQQNLNKRKWILWFINKKDLRFITTDFPLTSFNPNWSNWLKEISTLLFFPISPKVVLISTFLDSVKDFHCFEINSKSTVKFINKLIVWWACEEIYSDNKILLENMASYRKSPTREFKNWLYFWGNMTYDINVKII